MMGGTSISLTVQMLIDSGFLSKSDFFFDEEISHDGIGMLGQPQHDGGENISPLHILNAVKLSLMLTRSFVQYHNMTKYNTALESLQLDDFVVRIREEDGPNTGKGEEHLVSISSVDQLSAIGSNNDRTRWILLGIHVECPSDAPTTPVKNLPTLMQHLGKLIRSIFPRNDTIAPERHISNGDIDTGPDTMQHPPKSKRNTRISLFEQLIESGYPISICRFLNDLIDRGNAQYPITSFHDAINDLERMISQPHLYLFNPENEFHMSNLIFGQRYCGREKHLAKLLEITTVPNERRDGLEAIFISGVSGSGKSFLVSAVGSFLCSMGAMVLTAKFNRGMEYNSREIVSTLFDRMVANISNDNGNESDADYNRRAKQAIMNALDADSLSSLVDFLPSIQRLFPEIARNDLDCSHWQLVFLLSKLLGSVLSLERKIFIACDDLQWADSTMLSLISDVFCRICQYPEQRKHLVLVGMYRDDVVTSDLLSFTTSFEKSDVNVTVMKLSTFSLDDVAEIIMTHMRLPRRLVAGLADVVHKKTAHGHPLFVVQLLNSLSSDGIILYSPSAHRYDWDKDKVFFLKTPDSVASLIVSNLTSLAAESLQCLRIISCFGIQAQASLLDLLDAFCSAPQGGFESNIQGLVDQGILEVVGPMVAFTHDVIQEQVYAGIPAEERRHLHLDIGTFLGSKTSLDSSSQDKPIDAAIEQLYLSDGSDNEDTCIGVSSLVSIATSQINSAGPECFPDRRSFRFARWNLRAGIDASKLSSFRTALYYHKHGITFLGDELWLGNNYELSLSLYEGAAFSSSALGEINQISHYANEIITNAGFEDTIYAQYLLIGSLQVSGRYQEAVARGLAVLRELKFDIPHTPSPMIVVEAMKQTEMEASVYDFSLISAHSSERIDSKTRNIMKLVEAISVSAYHIASPFLPLVACETIRFSLQNGICEESASAYVIFAYFQIFLKQGFGKARRWGSIAKSMLEKANAEGLVMRTRLKLFGLLWFWYTPLEESRNHLQKIHDLSLKVGETESAYISMCIRLKFSFFRGEQLSIVAHSFDKHLKPMAKFSIGSAIFSTLDKEVVDELTGHKSSNLYSIFQGRIPDKKSLLADAESKSHFQMVEAVHLQNFIILFWNGDYVEAEKASTIAMSFPSAKMPKIQLIYHIFYRGIVAFNLYRDGKGENWLGVGIEMLNQMEIWVENSKPIIENKLILIEAEHYASMCNVVAAKESYVLSIQVARDNGYIHEQGLAYECMGKYLSLIVEVQEAEFCFMNAYECYMQWGAVAKAKKLWKDHNLELSTADIDIGNIKHERDE